jgi:iron(III) transport system permease protein
MKLSTSIRRFALLIFFLLVFSPPSALIVDLIGSLFTGHGTWLGLMIPIGRKLDLFIRSLELAVGVAISGMVLGILGAIFLWRWRTGIRAHLRWSVLLLIVIPPYVHALAWVSAINGINSLLNAIGFPNIPFQGWLASWWIQLMALVPITIGLTLIGLESVDPDLIEAARMTRSDIYNLFNVILPLAKPLILAGGGFVFLLSFTDYSIPSLFHLNVYSLESFAEFSASNEPSRSFLSTIPLLLITVLVLFASQGALRNAVLKPTRQIYHRTTLPVWPTWFITLQRVGIALLLAQIFIPLFVLTITVGTWDNMVGAAASARSEILFTFWISVITATLCLPMGLAAASKLVKRDNSSKMWWFLVTIPFAVPAPLIGIGLITIWNKPLIGAVYGSNLMPVLASLARFTPFAAIVLLAQLRRVDPLLIDAARVFHTRRSKTWMQIHLPILAPGILAAGFIAFALCAGELGATLIVAPPGQATVTMRIYNYLHYGASETVAGLCLMMIMVALISGVLAVVVVRRGLRLFPKSM